jgi:hypothetical protein
MSFNEKQIEKINFFRVKVLHLTLERIFDHGFDTKEVLINNYHHTGCVGITIESEKENGQARYNLRSLKTARENEKLTQLLEIEGVEDVVFTNAKNLMLLFNEKFLKELIESEKFKNLEIGIESIDKFNL